MGRSRMYIQLVAALVLALAAGWLVLQWLEAAALKNAQGPDTGPERQVVVAATELPSGQVLAEEHLRTAVFLEDSLPERYFNAPEDLLGRVVTAPLAEGELITPSRLAGDDVLTGGIGAMVKEGMRAIAVRGDEVLGLAGFVRPGHRVDVLTTMEDEQLPGKAMTKVVLENVLVLATGRELEPDASGEPQPVDIYTLELTPVQTERLGLAATRGVLHFALRNPSDGGQVTTTGANIPNTFMNRGSDSRYTVEVIRGGVSQRVRF